MVAFILFSSVLAKGQISVYHPFPEANAAWYVTSGGWEPEAGQCYDRCYYLSGDTSIGSVNYHKIWFFGWNGLPNFNSHLCDFWSYSSTPCYCLAFRQDTLLRKVYIIPAGDTVENVLYDFSLNVGDTLHTYNCYGSGYVSAIDSILVGTQYRKQFVINESSLQGFIVEGIGSKSGLIEGLVGFEVGGYLYCFSRDNIALFPNSGGLCELTMDISVNPELKEDVLIKPNPFNTVAMVEVPGHLKKPGMQLFNILGFKVREIDLAKPISVLERNGLPAGIYFYRIYDTKRLVSFGKLIIQ
ncbi:MAG: T9SS type A sorting domain-containing protein [Bacteroidetes bacterium]|nr:T9SS type A sorting domain-containing protein [Bacteroidota bacterium]